MLLFGLSGLVIAKKKQTAPTDLNVFKKTIVWDAAKALYKHDFETAVLFFELKPELINFQEKKYRQTLLLWAVKNEMAQAVEFLLEFEADPELKDRSGMFPLIQAASYQDAYLLKILLKHQANPSVIAQPEGVDGHIKLRTPLIAASAVGTRNIDLLLDAGADLNYTETKFGLQNALTTAFKSQQINIIRHLIIEKKINLDNIQHRNYRGDSTDVTIELRKLVYPLDSDEYKVKMEIVDYLYARKINYWNAPVPRKLYHNFSQKFLKQY